MTTASRIISALPPGSLVLDLGGWFKPLAEATHVVDLMPYETRGARLTLEPQAGERFSRATWRQADFSAPSFRLPFPDRTFAFAYCGQTLEDLIDPAPLLNEMRRVARGGLIRSPSRLSEQTRGVRDRRTNRPGHPHHHWIIDPLPAGLRLCAKFDSLSPGGSGRLIPLRHYERRLAQTPDAGADFEFRWEGRFDCDFVRGAAAAELAQAFVRDQRIRLADRLLDPLIRRGRALKHRLRGPLAQPTEDWWRSMLELSRPYNALPPD